MILNTILAFLVLGLAYIVSPFWLFGLVYVLINYLRLFQIRKLKKIRDNADLTDEYGKALIRGCNKRINILNGFIGKF